MTTQTVTQISAAARGKWPVILQMLRIDVPENGRHGPCPKCGGKDRFRLDDLDGRG
ncbi:primase-helicase zinc-binding domain-containing protein, partial [Salmonella enterica subsp. enterica serovar Bareilly]|nr:DNA primase [Salmonella enterica]MBJ3538026.1 DNA primase [Salmonella enterica subsp. enterica serovar Derby]